MALLPKINYNGARTSAVKYDNRGTSSDVYDVVKNGILVYHKHRNSCYKSFETEITIIPRCPACERGDHANHVPGGGRGTCWYDTRLGWHCNCQVTEKRHETRLVCQYNS